MKPAADRVPMLGEIEGPEFLEGFHKRYKVYLIPGGMAKKLDLRCWIRSLPGISRQRSSYEKNCIFSVVGQFPCGFVC